MPRMIRHENINAAAFDNSRVVTEGNESVWRAVSQWFSHDIHECRWHEFPIDILWLDADHKVVHVAEKVRDDIK